ncbi:hypothetical protein G6F33_013686 [Rhizopus arrhizus]|nr:hypothetical protein G6F33_013686 [Rhizopus arrhizus]
MTKQDNANLFSPTGNRTPAMSVKATDPSHWTIEDVLYTFFRVFDCYTRFRLNNHPSINPSTVNTSLQVSPSEVQKPSRYPQKTSLLNTKKNSNNINNKQAPASPEPSSATKRTLADRSPPIFPADLARQPSGKPKHHWSYGFWCSSWYP